MALPVLPALAGEDFAAVFKSPWRARSAHFSLHWRATPPLPPTLPDAPAAAAASRLGMVVAKRLARTAIRRNLIKRQTRALFADWLRGTLAANVPATGPAPRDVVLRLTRNPVELARAAQFAELQTLFAALK